MSHGENLLALLIGEYFSNSYYWEIFNKKAPNILFNVRPEFISKLELDSYIPELKTAFEFQGEQHYILIDVFKMKKEDLLKRIFFDIQKDLLCKKNNICLVRVSGIGLTSGSFRNTIFNTFHNFYKYCPIKVQGGYKPSEFSPIYEKYSIEHKVFLSAVLYPKQKHQVREINSYTKKYVNYIKENFTFSKMNCYSVSNMYWKVLRMIKEKDVVPYLRDGLSAREVMDHGLTMFF